jgi:hypothetical protein
MRKLFIAALTLIAIIVTNIVAAQNQNPASSESYFIMENYYKIKFYDAHETGNFMTQLYFDLGELIFESPVLTLDEGTKNKVEINLEDYNINISDKDMFVYLELQDYYDENNSIVKPEIKDETMLKVQLSKLTNYYTKMHDILTGENTKFMININAMINRDFAFMFFKKPHKSELVAPAIILNVTKKNKPSQIIFVQKLKN